VSRWQYSCEHTGPGTLAGRYMRQFWQPVYAMADIAPGGTKPLRIMGQDLTLYRGASGTPYVVAFRCAHRGVQLSVGQVDGEDIRCMYHGWKYSGQGQCVEQPGELENQFASRVKIRGYPTRDYHGLVFAYLGEGGASEFPIFQELEGDGIVDVGITAVRDLWNEQLKGFSEHGEGRVWVQPPPAVVTSGEDRRQAG
jgi:5,5'-dehydrodivanillate O-demethylase